MKKLSISEVCGKAWSLATSHLVLVLFAFIAMVVIMIAEELFGGAAATYNITPGMSPEKMVKETMEMIQEGMLGSICSTIVSIVVFIGFDKLCLNTHDGIKPAWTAWKMPVGRYVTAFLVAFCVGFLELVGLCFFVIPGIWLSCRLLFASLAVIDDPECGFSEAFSRSWNMTRGHSWTLFGLGIVACIFALIGVCCFFVGIFFAIPLITLMEVVAFRTLLDDGTVEYEEVSEDAAE